MCLLRKIKNIKSENSAKKFGGIKKSGYLCNAKAETLIEILAKIAQLVEHDLAKVGVAGSSPVFRSKKHNTEIRCKESEKAIVFCENSSVGRARPCQGRGRGFESRFSLSETSRLRRPCSICPDGGIGRRATLRG